jgi:hypothetical protein
MVREPMTWPQIWPFELTIYQDKSCDQVTPLEFLKIGICLDATKNYVDEIFQSPFVSVVYVTLELNIFIINM